MRIHDPKLRSMARALSLSVFIFIFRFTFILNRVYGLNTSRQLNIFSGHKPVLTVMKKTFNNAHRLTY